MGSFGMIGGLAGGMLRGLKEIEQQKNDEANRMAEQKREQLAEEQQKRAESYDPTAATAGMSPDEKAKWLRDNYYSSANMQKMAVQQQQAEAYRAAVVGTIQDAMSGATPDQMKQLGPLMSEAMGAPDLVTLRGVAGKFDSYNAAMGKAPTVRYTPSGVPYYTTPSSTSIGLGIPGVTPTIGGGFAGAPGGSATGAGAPSAGAPSGGGGSSTLEIPGMSMSPGGVASFRKPSEKETGMADTINEASTLIDSVDSMIPSGAGSGPVPGTVDNLMGLAGRAKEYGKYKMHMDVPADESALFTNVSQLQARLNGVVAALSGTRAYRAIAQVQGHIPSPYDSPRTIAIKLQEWKRALADAKKQLAQGPFEEMTGPASGSERVGAGGGAPSSGGGGHNPGDPIYVKGTLVGRVAPDGTTMIPINAGGLPE